MKRDILERLQSANSELIACGNDFSNPLLDAKAEIERLRKDAARYNWLAGKVFPRGETCLALYEEFGGAPFKGETVRKFLDRYIDEAMTPN